MTNLACTLESKRRIFVVDDHPIVRRGLELLIGQEPDLTVCGEADSAETAFEGILTARPDLAVVDLALKARSGLDLIEQLHAHCPEVKILVFSMHDEATFEKSAVKAGAHGYLTKQKGTENAIGAVRELLEGRSYWSGGPTAGRQETARRSAKPKRNWTV